MVESLAEAALRSSYRVRLHPATNQLQIPIAKSHAAVHAFLHDTTTIGTAVMTSNRPEELFIALLRSAYSNGCRHAVLAGRPTRALPQLAFLRAQTPSSRGFATGRAMLPYVPKALYTRSSRSYATAASPQPPAKAKADAQSPPPSRKIAVLGGGITGLTAAHYLARHAKNAHITLYEGGDHLGGWIKGEVAQTAEGEDILLQRGPRMLRSGASGNKYDDLVLYDVVSSLCHCDRSVVMYADCPFHACSSPTWASETRSFTPKAPPIRVTSTIPTTS